MEEESANKAAAVDEMEQLLSDEEQSRDRSRSPSPESIHSDSNKRERSRSRSNSLHDDNSAMVNEVIQTQNRQNQHEKRTMDSNSRHDVVPSIELPNVDTRLSYREYVLGKPDTVTMEEAEEGYENYCRREQYKNAISFFDSISNQEWLVEMEVPSAHKQYLRKCIQNNLREARKWKTVIESGEFFTQEAEQRTPPEEGTYNYTYPIRNFFKDRCIYIHSIPSSCTRQCLLDYLEKYDGVESVYFGDAFHCPPSELNRPAYVLFKTPAQMLAASKHMMGVHVPLVDTASLGLNGVKEAEDGKTRTFIMLCSLWKTPQKPSFLRSVANIPERIEKDLANCRRVWEAAEKFWGCETGLLEALDGFRASHAWMCDEYMIDALVFLLRRVFGIDYWFGENHYEFGVSLHYHGQDMVRTSLLPMASEDDTWAAQVDSRVDALLTELSSTSVQQQLDERTALEEREEEVRKTERERFIERNIVVPSKENMSDKRQCLLCSKNFISAEYVRNHIVNKHMQQIEIAENKAVLLEVIRADYIKNPKSRIPNVVPVKIISRSTTVAPKVVETEDLQKLVEYANTYVDRDIVEGIKINVKRSVNDVFNDDL